MSTEFYALQGREIREQDLAEGMAERGRQVRSTKGSQAEGK